MPLAPGLPETALPKASVARAQVDGVGGVVVAHGGQGPGPR